jgi:RHS repeat-associated protein
MNNEVFSVPSYLRSLRSTMQPHLDRGYTGHEHMAGFGLINMNGRLYDPYLQRFLSPDPYVQEPGNAQNYNRYSYCPRLAEAPASVGLFLQALPANKLLQTAQ